jgi:hypothetical protein
MLVCHGNLKRDAERCECLSFGLGETNDVSSEVGFGVYSYIFFRI